MFESLDPKLPALRELIKELRKQYAYASVLAVSDNSRSWRVARSGVNIRSAVMGGGNGYVVRVFDKTGCAEYSFNEFSEEKIPAILDAMKERLSAQTENLPGEITPLPTPIPSDEPATLKKATPFVLDPRELGDEAILQKLKATREKGLQTEGVLDVIVQASYRACRKVFLSENRELDQTLMWTNGGILALASRGEEIKDAYRPYSVLGGAEIFDTMENDVTDVCKVALELLSSEQIEPGEYDCV